MSNFAKNLKNGSTLALDRNYKPLVEVNPSGVDIPDLKNIDLHNFIDECIAKKDRYVNIFFSPHGITISMYPLDEDESD